MEIMVACSAMALAKRKQYKGGNNQSLDSSSDKWNRGGIISAAALTKGTLMAITGELAAPTILAGLGALAHILGTLVSIIGASGFAAAATIIGTVASSFG